MTESLEELEGRLREAIVPGARSRLIDRGLARGLIWLDGVVPEGGPPFAVGLTEDLLDYGHSVLDLALRVRSLSRESTLLSSAFEIAGEAIESAVHRDERNLSHGFHRVSAATAFHLARLSARAYSILPGETEGHNFSPCELAIVHLLRRRFAELKQLFSSRMLDADHQDEAIALRLLNDDDFEADDAIHESLVNAFMKGIALFDHALQTGLEASATASKAQLTLTASVASDLRSVNHWWTATLASHLVDELWDLSLHNKLPKLPEDGSAVAREWNRLRLNYIQRLRAAKRAAIELWPSQLAAAARSLNPLDDLVVALPTSAGKTRIAELCILRALAEGKRAIYITPLRALSAQIEGDLGETFIPLGFSVSSLYGAAGVEAGDNETLRTGKIVVATPEKLDFALRNDPTIIDDIGLIVFDEGHMLGKGEREVRYETLVQRILRRADSGTRRIVCLSALFPNPEDMKDLVAWIRQDEVGEPVHSNWRPTRQRFGTIQWFATGSARLQITLSDQNPYVPDFVKLEPPPRPPRQNPMPQNKNELVLASAWKFVEQKKRVLIYCSTKRSVQPLGNLVLQLIRQGVLQPLVEDSEKLQRAREIGEEWLGPAHPAVVCLKYGVALHHASLPRQFLAEVEMLLKEGTCPLTIASPTLAQGLNLSASVLLVPTIWRNAEIIPIAEFANVAGRAGRAFVDLEGLILNTIWPGNATRDLRLWERLVRDAKAPLLKSGILKLVQSLCAMLAADSGRPIGEVVDYVTGNTDAWNVEPTEGAEDEEDIAWAWDRELASLDAALLGMLDPNEAEEALDSSISESLAGSLPVRQALAGGGQATVDWMLSFLAARAKEIWRRTDSNQRTGFYSAGVGLRAGLSLDEHLDPLVNLIVGVESGIQLREPDGCSELVIEFAEVVFGFAPFIPDKELPADWKDALRRWMNGDSVSSIVELCGESGVDFIQDAVAYRIPWAMEAVRVHALSVSQESAEEITGMAAMAVETGSLNQSVITLIHKGLQSREAAKLAVADARASFRNAIQMRFWLRSETVVQRSSLNDWPSAKTHYAWMKFYARGFTPREKTWARKLYYIDVQWHAPPLTPGTDVILVESDSSGVSRILSIAYEPLAAAEFDVDLQHLVRAYVGTDDHQIMLEYFGPDV